jgi:hypothetical protein
MGVEETMGAEKTASRVELVSDAVWAATPLGVI